MGHQSYFSSQFPSLTSAAAVDNFVFTIRIATDPANSSNSSFISHFGAHNCNLIKQSSHFRRVARPITMNFFKALLCVATLLLAFMGQSEAAKVRVRWSPKYGVSVAMPKSKGYRFDRAAKKLYVSF